MLVLIPLGVLEIIMAPLFDNLFLCVLYVFLLFIPFANMNQTSSENLVEYSHSDIATAVKEGCVLVALNQTTSEMLTTLKRLSRAFVNESRVYVGVLKHSEVITWDYSSANFFDEEDLAFFPQRKLDRSCLLRPRSWDNEHVKAEQFHGLRTVENLLSFLNAKCQTFRELDGSLSSGGKTRDRILQNLYHVPNTLNAASTGPVNVATACDRIPPPTREQFFYDYFWRSKPVIITGALKTWPAMVKWTSEFLRTKFGDRVVRVAFAPNGEYEGCDKAKHFDNFQDFDIPEAVKSQLHFPDLVVVRPAFLDIPFSTFMEIIQSSNNSNVSAYLEYSSIPSLLPELEHDVRELPFISGKLKRRHLNIWLSNGNTLGKLHFDPFDNFLCQISGKKQLFLYEPHNNTKLYEAHIQEATLGYDAGRLIFHRQKLLDSTSMVMSPVDILQPDYGRFPEFKEARALNCTINQGDVLFLPSFWWHEVQSYPSETEPRNMAVNFWYEPFFTKEFPCATCKMDVNSFYYHMLD